MSDDTKIVAFEKYCPTCRHFKSNPMLNPDIGDYNSKTGWSGIETKEEYMPCCYCLEEGAREGTEVPVEWEEK